MKKIVSVLLLAAFMFTFAACGQKQTVGNELPKADKYQWNMSYISKIGGEIVARGEESNTSFTHVAEIEMTAKIKRGTIEIKDITNGKTYEGEYIESGVTPDSREYKFTVDGVEGYGFTAMTKYFDGEAYYEAPTMIMQLGEYSLAFEAVME